MSYVISLEVTMLTLLHIAWVCCSVSFKELLQKMNYTTLMNYTYPNSMCLLSQASCQNQKHRTVKKRSLAFLVIRNSSPWLPTVCFLDNFCALFFFFFKDSSATILLILFMLLSLYYERICPTFCFLASNTR